MTSGGIRARSHTRQHPRLAVVEPVGGDGRVLLRRPAKLGSPCRIVDPPNGLRDRIDHRRKVVSSGFLRSNTWQRLNVVCDVKLNTVPIADRPRDVHRKQADVEHRVAVATEVSLRLAAIGGE